MFRLLKIFLNYKFIQRLVLRHHNSSSIKLMLSKSRKKILILTLLDCKNKRTLKLSRNYRKTFSIFFWEKYLWIEIYLRLTYFDPVIANLSMKTSLRRLLWLPTPFLKSFRNRFQITMDTLLRHLCIGVYSIMTNQCYRSHQSLQQWAFLKTFQKFNWVMGAGIKEQQKISFSWIRRWSKARRRRLMSLWL